MKKSLLLLVFALSSAYLSAQDKTTWKKHDGGKVITSDYSKRATFPTDYQLMELDLNGLKNKLITATDRFAEVSKYVTIEIPNADGAMEQFTVLEASNFSPSLQAKFPEIRSYVGNGLTDRYAKLRIAINPRGISAMITRADKATEFIEPYSLDGKIHVVYSSKNVKGMLPFNCTSPTDNKIIGDLTKAVNSTSRSNTNVLLNFRLAMSVTPEYTAYHHAALGLATAKQSALSAINTTMSRVNGVFETDFAIHMNLVDNMTIIYDGTTTDPYGATDANYNSQLQSTLTSVVGEANYDVGHLMANVGNNGNAGCIGCVCEDGSKGSGYTTSTVPVGDNFDIDYVVHEIGHQFGANHTFSNSNEAEGVNVEVGSGVTIMGYAGITSYDTHLHSIDVFHAVSIAQVQGNMASKTCPTTTQITHAAPVVNAGQDWTIPLSTPFALTGSATDAGGSNAITYTWQQIDDGGSNTNANSAAKITKTSGPNWVNYQDSASGLRNFPVMSTILEGSETTSGLDVNAEALSSVARTLNFRLTARDNVLGQGQTNFDDMVVNVVAKSPLKITIAANTSYPVGSTQTVVWTGATGTTGHQTISGASNVDILFSANDGSTWTTLLTATQNDGSESVTLPAGASGPFCRFMVKASANVFFNISPKFAVGYTITNTCNTYSNSTPLTIPDGTAANVNGAVVSNTIAIPVTYNLSDVNVTLNVTHTYPNDLVIALNHPDNTQDILWGRSCSGNDNFNVTLSDGSPTFTCVANMTGTFKPYSPLAVFNNKTSNGTWRLLATDYYDGDTGTINSWSIEVCSQTITLSVPETQFTDFVVYPNPSRGNFNVKFNSSTSNAVKMIIHDMRGRVIYNNDFNNNGVFNENIQLDNVQSGVYLLSVTDGVKKEVKRIVIE
ncbi:zinc-dependent metalloprotease [Flavobacterium branchiophilum]|uniref:Propanediol utilization protein n=1 Tax=Flavobacterium branchiophilum TaxID=55197 RepID=A0A2H3KCH4_9FLAO|nr:zinc-dependent metalloprotease family protein [Flavobacterium branchiophilum]PDS25048.1 propanediol utilization protein [Flavobacterium branchiophilum]